MFHERREGTINQLGRSYDYIKANDKPNKYFDEIKKNTPTCIRYHHVNKQHGQLMFMSLHQSVCLPPRFPYS